MKKKGFTLIELMIVAVILGVSFLTIYGIYVKLYDASGRTEIKAVAIALAQETMEDVVNRPFTKILLWGSSSPSPPSTYEITNKDNSTSTETVVSTSSGTEADYVSYQQTINKLGTSFTVTTIITWHDDPEDDLASSSPNPDPDPNDYKRVHVSVSWPGAGSQVVLDRFVSLYYRPYAQSTAAADAGEFRLDDNSNYARLGSTSLSTYTGGNRTSKAEAQAFSTYNVNDSGDIGADNTAWTRVFTDDDSSPSSPATDDDTESKSAFNDLPIVASGESTAKVSSASMSNRIGIQGWHSGDPKGNDVFNDWPDPPIWTQSWTQPSAIAKTSLATAGMYWSYTPAHDQGKRLFKTGSADAGSKSVITSDSSNDKVVTRSWSEINNVKIVELSGATVVSIDKVEAFVESEANGSGIGTTNIFWKLTGFEVQGFAKRDVESVIDISDITPLPAPLSSITVGDVDEDIMGNQVQASVDAIVIKINEDSALLSDKGITIPASTITLGTASANVSYTTK